MRCRALAVHLLALLLPCTRASLISDQFAIVVLPNGGEAITDPEQQGFCTDDEKHRLNKILIEKAWGTPDRNLRERRLDPMWFCCPFCEFFAECYTAVPACEEAPYKYGDHKKDECPKWDSGNRRFLATVDDLEERVDDIKAALVVLVDKLQDLQAKLAEEDKPQKREKLEAKIEKIKGKITTKQAKLKLKMSRMDNKLLKQCQRKAKKIENWLDDFVAGTAPEVFSPLCKKLFAEGQVDLICAANQ